MNGGLEIRRLRVEVEEKEIIKGLDLEVPSGELHAIMGPNGSGKSTLANVIMGHPGYRVLSGDILFKGSSILEKSTDERARMGIFLAFQYPTSIPGVPLDSLIRRASCEAGAEGARRSVREFQERLKKAAVSVGFSYEMVARPVNEGFSGGEKKKAEVLQMEMLEPDFVIMDEVDSGLDIDALKSVASVVNGLRGEGRSFLVITHYERILSIIEPEKIHVMKDGRIVRTGDGSLVEELEKAGYGDLEAA